MIGEVLGVDELIILAVPLVSFGLALWALADAAVRQPAINDGGPEQTLWIILPIVGIFVFSIVEGILGAVDRSAIRPKVKESQLGW